jgi:hypothetical protein
MNTYRYHFLAGMCETATIPSEARWCNYPIDFLVGTLTDSFIRKKKRDLMGWDLSAYNHSHSFLEDICLTGGSIIGIAGMPLDLIITCYNATKDWLQGKYKNLHTEKK